MSAEEEIDPFLARAIAPNKTKGQLEFKKGQEITVEKINKDQAFYFGFYGKKEGWFPDYFVQRVNDGHPVIRQKPAPKGVKAANPKTAVPKSANPVDGGARKMTKKEMEQKKKQDKAAAKKEAKLKKKGSSRKSRKDSSADERSQLPPIVEASIQYLEQPDRLKMEGLFRVSGSLNEVKQIKAEFLKGKKVDLSKVNDPHTVAGVLKIFFRESKDPLLTFELYDCWVAAIATPQEGDRLASIRQVIELLPAANKRILIRLMELLSKVAQNQKYNLMSVNNIAIVFAPTLLRPPGDQIDIAIQDSSYANHLIKFMIEEYEVLFGNTSAANAPKIADPPLEPVAPITEDEFDKRLRRGSLLIAKGSIGGGANSFEFQGDGDSDSDISIDLNADDIEGDTTHSESDDTNPSDNEDTESSDASSTSMSMEEMMDKILEGQVAEVDEFLATLSPDVASATKKDLLARIDALMQSEDFKD